MYPVKFIVFTVYTYMVNTGYQSMIYTHHYVSSIVTVCIESVHRPSQVSLEVLLLFCVENSAPHTAAECSE